MRRDICTNVVHGVSPVTGFSDRLRGLTRREINADAIGAACPLRGLNPAHAFQRNEHAEYITENRTRPIGPS